MAGRAIVLLVAGMLASVASTQYRGVVGELFQAQADKITSIAETVTANGR